MSPEQIKRGARALQAFTMAFKKELTTEGIEVERVAMLALSDEDAMFAGCLNPYMDGGWAWHFVKLMEHVNTEPIASGPMRGSDISAHEVTKVKDWHPTAQRLAGALRRIVYDPEVLSGDEKSDVASKALEAEGL